jgi:hypothetical protein
VSVTPNDRIELGQTGVAIAFCKMMIFHHTFDAEVFKEVKI